MIDLRDSNVVQTEAICLEAVRETGLALEHVVNQTEAICLEAVRETGLALEYVVNQTDAICLEALARYEELNWGMYFRIVCRKIKYPSPQLISILLKLYPLHADTIMTKYACGVIDNYKSCRCAIMLHLVQHANDLLYRPNNVNALVGQMRWCAVSNAKTLFLTP